MKINLNNFSFFSGRLGKIMSLWAFHEAYKAFSFFIIFAFPLFAYGSIYYLVLGWVIITLVFFYKTIPLFRDFVTRSLEEDNEKIRLLFCKGRSYLLLLLILELFPFLMVPQPVLKYLFWKLDNKIQEVVS